MVSKKQIQDVEGVIGSMTLTELLALRTGLNERITELQNEKKDEFLKNMRAQAEQLNLPMNEIVEALGFRSAGMGKRTSVDGSGVAMKYRNPRNHTEHSSGRGRRAAWLVREMAMKGLTEKDPIPSEFLIENQK